MLVRRRRRLSSSGSVVGHEEAVMVVPTEADFKRVAQQLGALATEINGWTVAAPIPPDPPDPPLPASRVLFGATYSEPTLPAVFNYKVQCVPAFGWGSTEANLDG